MWTVYLLKHSISNQYYIGKTNDLKRRLIEHNSGGQTSTIRKSGKWIVIYAEAYRSKQDADERERMLKHHGSSKRGLYKRIKRSMLDS